jgi:hypothetical protein
MMPVAVLESDEGEDGAKDEGNSVGIGTAVVEGDDGDKGAVMEDDGEPGKSGGGGTRVLGMSAIGTTKVVINITPYPAKAYPCKTTA